MEGFMKSFWGACLVIMAIGVGAAFILDSSFQRGASQAFVTSGARL
jgi:hypothetical protein